MKTRAGIEYNLKCSPYSCSFNGVRFIFSSIFHCKNFILQRGINLNKLNESLSNRFKFSINIPILSDLQLYSKIETRGFLIQNEKGEYLCKENLILSGEKVMKRN